MAKAKGTGRTEKSYIPYRQRTDKAVYNHGTKELSINCDLFRSRIEFLAADFIEREAKSPDNVKDWFPAMVDYIRQNIPKPDINNITVLKSVFEDYITLCNRVGYIPTIYSYCRLAQIEVSTFDTWINGECRAKTPEYAELAKTVKGACGSQLVDKMTQGGASVNQIFVAKALYGMTETAPVQRIEHVHMIGMDGLPMLNMSATDGKRAILTDDNSGATE